MNMSKVSLLVVDALRYDCIEHLSLTDSLKRDNALSFLDTPTMNNLCKDSVCFTNCYSIAAATSQVISSMFTGTTPINHGITHNSASAKLKLNEQIITMAEVFKKLDYLTVLAGDPPKHLKTHHVFRGFDFDFSDSDKKLFQFLNDHIDDKIFLFSLFEDVHAPYLYSPKPPSPNYNDDIKEIMNPLFDQYKIPFPNSLFNTWRELYKINQSRELWLPIYVRGVSKFDKGRFNIFINNLKETKFLEPDNSLMVITADHGEGKCFHSKPQTFSHGGDAFDDNSKVPLIVRLPSLKHEIRNDLVSNIDVFKLILDLVSDYNTQKYVSQKLRSINPLSDKRNYSWYIFSVGMHGLDDTQYRLYARTIITKNKKFTLRGRPEDFLSPEIFEISDDDFIHKLYANFYISSITDDQLNKERQKLDKVSKKDLYESFITNNRGKNVPKCFVIDLKIDPMEEHPLDPFVDKNLAHQYLYWFDHMLDIDRPDYVSEKHDVVLTNKEKLEEQEIKEELQKLGYL